MSNWFKADEKLPHDGQTVIAAYEGVYSARIVTFWRDDGGGNHFGSPDESDGKGSQPATHWTNIPD